MGLIPAFVEATGEKLVGGPFCPPLPPILNRVNGKLHFLCSVSPKSLIKINNYLSLDGCLFLYRTLSSTLAFQFLLCWDQPTSKRQKPWRWKWLSAVFSTPLCQKVLRRWKIVFFSKYIHWWSFPRTTLRKMLKNICQISHGIKYSRMDQVKFVEDIV